MKKSRSKFLKIVDEKHDINFHWPNKCIPPLWFKGCYDRIYYRHACIVFQYNTSKRL
jgi:hypothetical protein